MNTNYNQGNPQWNQGMPPRMPNQQPPRKKNNTWVWVIVAVIGISVIASFFADDDTAKKDAESNAQPTEQISKEEWTNDLTAELANQSEYLDSVVARAKRTTATEMLLGYLGDIDAIANKTIRDSLYMDVYELPEIAKLMNDNSAKATKILPQLGKICREQYAKTLGKKLWEDNIYVELSNGSKTITFIGGIFANNRNIKQWQEGCYNQLAAFGFKQVRYKWIKHATEYTYYDL